MARLLRVLHLEDQPNDVTLIRSALDGEGLDCQIRQVTTREAFTRALERGGFDIILSDHSLPSYDGLSALALARQLAPTIPFIMVTGTLREESIDLCLRSGATACVLKHDLPRLCRVMREALGDDWNDRERRQA